MRTKRKVRVPRGPSKKDRAIELLEAQKKRIEDEAVLAKRAIDRAHISNFIYQVLGCPLSDRAVVAGHELNQQNQAVNFLIPFKVLREFCETVKRMEYGK